MGICRQQCVTAYYTHLSVRRSAPTCKLHPPNYFLSHGGFNVFSVSIKDSKKCVEGDCCEMVQCVITNNCDGRGLAELNHYIGSLQLLEFARFYSKWMMMNDTIKKDAVEFGYLE